MRCPCDEGVLCGVAHSQSTSAEDVGLTGIEPRLAALPLDWTFVLWQGALMLGTFLVPNAATGVVLSAMMLMLWKRKAGWREAVVAMFVVACVLASSRAGGLQYWKPLRLVFAALVVVEALRAFRGMPTMNRRSSVGFVLMMVLCTGMPAVFSEYVAEGIEETILLSSMWWAMLVLGRIHHQGDATQRFITLMHVGMLVALVSVFVRFWNFELGHLNGRFRGVFGNPNEFSHWWLGIGVLGLLGSNSLKNVRTLFLLAATVLFYYWSGTRGALAAFAFSVGGWFLLHVPQSFASQMTKVLLASAVILAMTAVSTDVLLDVLPDRVVRQESLGEGGGRLLAWEHAWQQIIEQPWVGAGGGAEERYFRENYTFFALQNHQGLSHNSWLAFAMNFGVPATLVLFFMLLWRLGLMRRSLFIMGSLPLIFSFTVEGWLTAPMSASSPMLFFVGGLLASVMDARGEASQTTD